MKKKLICLFFLVMVTLFLFAFKDRAIDFFAPTVADKDNLTDIVETGTIVFDANENKFYGRTLNSTADEWIDLSFSSNDLNQNQGIYSASSNYTILDDDGYGMILITTGSSSNITITLPTNADNNQRIIEIIKIDSGTKFVEITKEGSDTIRGSSNSIYAIQQNESIKLYSNGEGNWILLGDPIRTVSAAIESDGSTGSMTGNWISSSKDSTGTYYMDWVTGVFLNVLEANPVVSPDADGGTMSNIAGIRQIDGTRFVVNIRTDAGALSDKKFRVICSGKK